MKGNAYGVPLKLCVASLRNFNQYLFIRYDHTYFNAVYNMFGSVAGYGRYCMVKF